jgi:hypothetical protein
MVTMRISAFYMRVPNRNMRARQAISLDTQNYS